MQSPRVNELNARILWRVAAVAVSLMLSSNLMATQASQERGGDELRLYYSDLYLALSGYNLNEVPFKHKKVRVLRGDSLIRIAQRYSIAQLDPFHLAAALYENNSAAFLNNNASVLKAGATIKMPTVEDIFIAQDRYEKIKVVGQKLLFSSKENQMRNALRIPFAGISSPATQDELPGNQVVTLTSYRADVLPAVSYGGEMESMIDVSPAATRTGSHVTHHAQSQRRQGFSRWAEFDDSGLTERQLTSANQRQSVTKSVEKRLVPAASSVATIAKSENAETAVKDVQLARTSGDQLQLTGESDAAKDAPVITRQIEPEPKKMTKPEPAALDNSGEVADHIEITGPALQRSEHNIGGDSSPARIETSANTGNNSAIGSVEKWTIYLGPMDKSNRRSSDPLSDKVAWSFKDGTPVGTVVGKLAEYIGYELVSDDPIVLDTYARSLPVVQMQLTDITAEEGFAILAGRGLETTFDHVARSIKHTPKYDPAAKQSVPAAFNVDAGPANHEILGKLVETAGITNMLEQFPADITSAAERHADRCKSVAGRSMVDSQNLLSSIVTRTGQQTPDIVARNLVKWFDSDTGRKVTALANAEIDYDELDHYKTDERRESNIEQIYDSTVTGIGISHIAIELDYAGWSISGCREKAGRSGDVKLINDEILYGQNIKTKVGKLEALLRDDMLHSMAYQLDSLSDQELAEYAAVMSQHAGVYAQLQDSIISAIQSATRDMIVSSVE